MIGSVTINHRHDAAGNTALTYLAINNGSFSVNDLFTAYTYDSQNRLSTVVDNNLPTGANTTTYLYDWQLSKIDAGSLLNPSNS
ncbi:MAG: hypothetical protein ACP5QA_14635 [Phycisphaerae bacterium]